MNRGENRRERVIFVNGIQQDGFLRLVMGRRLIVRLSILYTFDSKLIFRSFFIEVLLYFELIIF